MLKNDDVLFDIAKDITLEHGMPYYDPRTGERTDPAHTCVDNPDLVCPACRLAENGWQMKQIIWESRVDGRYDASVERTGDYTGELVVRDGEKELLREPTTLSYRALFGPDVSDVATWQERTIKFIDKFAEGK